LPVPDKGIFLSYRREDSAGRSGRLNDRLSLEFGRDSIFMDVDGIPLGTDFVKQLTREARRHQDSKGRSFAIGHAGSRGPERTGSATRLVSRRSRSSGS
jgi:hypothetical protein